LDDSSGESGRRNISQEEEILLVSRVEMKRKENGEKKREKRNRNLARKSRQNVLPVQ
jgi:hypothetical protein